MTIVSFCKASWTVSIYIFVIYWPPVTIAWWVIQLEHPAALDIHASGSLGPRRVKAPSLRDLVLVPRRDLRLEHGLRVAARSVGRVGL